MSFIADLRAKIGDTAVTFRTAAFAARHSTEIRELLDDAHRAANAVRGWDRKALKALLDELGIEPPEKYRPLIEAVRELLRRIEEDQKDVASPPA